MAIAEVQTQHGAPAASPYVATWSPTPTAGNCLVCVLVGITATTMVWSAPAGWNTGRLDNEAAVFWRIADGSEGASTNFTYTAAQAARGWNIELNGTHASAPFDTSGYTSFATTTTSATLTTDAVAAVDDEYAIAMVGHNGTNGGSETASNSYTLLATANSRDIGARRIYTGGAGASITTAIGWLTARAGRWVIASFKPAAGAPAPSVAPLPVASPMRW